MNERWVKATPAATRSSGIKCEPIYVNMAKALAIGPLDPKVDTTALASVTFEGGDQWFTEPPEHFLPWADLALVYAIDALKEIARPGSEGVTTIALEALAKINACPNRSQA